MLLVFACKKDPVSTIDYHYNYFPIDVGTWMEYEVVEINHAGGVSDTNEYLLREEITEEFVDLEGRTTYRIERFWRTLPTDAWAMKDVWYANRTQTTAERVEENIRYTKMVFPVNSSKYWDGNAFNTENEWEFSYDSIHDEKEYNNLTFDSTVTVEWEENFNVVEYEVGWEVYAKNVGLIYKKMADLDINNAMVTDINQGYEIEMTITAYGK